MTDAVALEFTDPAGDALRIEWDAEALAELVAPQPDAKPPWTLAGELDWDELEGLRIVSARLGTDRLLAVGALRPRGAGGHGEEVVAGALREGEQLEQLDEVLLSTEYGPDGEPRRIGIELYREPDGLPIRIAGDVVGTSSERNGRVRRDTAAFELRAGGDEGLAMLDVLSLE